MRYFEPRENYSYEKRGANWYAFCDDGCKVIVRPTLRAMRDAMDKHYGFHHGQMALELNAGRLDVPDVPPF